MAVLKLKISSARPTAYLTSNFQTAAAPKAVAERIKQYIERVACGNELAMSSSVSPQIVVDVQEDQTQASGTVTFSAVATADDTVIINGVTLTAVASGATNDQWNIGTGASGSANGLVACINASTTALVSGQVSATAAAGVVTIKAVAYGVTGNAITTAEGVDAGSKISVSGARLVGGAADAGQLILNF